MRSFAHKHGMFTETECELCHQPYAPEDLVCEAYDPDDDVNGSVVAHAACAVSRDMEIL